MIAWVFALLLLIDLGFLAWSFALARPVSPHPASPRLWFLRLMLFGMAYDNLALALGNLGVGALWYEAISYPRFLLHALILPLLVPFALSAMRVCAIPIARRRWFAIGCWLLAAIAWCYGLWQDVGGLELRAETALGHARLTSASDIPPLATIAVNLAVLALSFVIWRRAGWSLFFLGCLFILLVNGATATLPWGLLAGNGAEAVFILCLLLTERFLLRFQGSAKQAN